MFSGGVLGFCFCAHNRIKANKQTPAITDSGKILGESYRCLNETNSRYYGHFIRPQRYSFIVFSLAIPDTEQHLGIFAQQQPLYFPFFAHKLHVFYN